MTPAEYVQLKAFARVDGLYMGVVWIISFGCYIMGLTTPLLGMTGVLIAAASPVLAAMRLRRFRDSIRGGTISYPRAMAYYMLIFFYASLVLAIAQYVYFAYIDRGFVIGAYNDMLSAPETVEIMKAYGVTAGQMEENLSLLQQTKPIYLVFNILTFNLTAGIIMSLPVAAIMRRTAIK